MEHQAGGHNEPSASVTVSSLEAINEYCLCEILQYLDIIDIVNLSRASKRLLQFSKALIFPNAVKECSVVDYGPDKLKKLSYNRRTIEIELTPESLEAGFRYFGEFVEDLELHNAFTENLLANCHNLKKLYFYSNSFESNGTHELQNQIERLQYLKELKFDGYHRFTSKWRASNGISIVIKLTLGQWVEVNGNFIDYFKNLTSLSVEIMGYSSRIDDLVQILNNSRNTLKHLKVTDKATNSAVKPVSRLIIDKLHKLEYLELEFFLTDETTFSHFQLPHLKSVGFYCSSNYSVNSVLRTLSDNGIIEELTFDCGVFDESVANAQPPLNFRKLRKFGWTGTTQHRFAGLLNTLTKSQMPELQTIEFESIANNELDSLIRFIKSKNTLKTMKLHFSNPLVPLSFWRQIIEILKDYSTPRRPFLSIVLIHLQEEEVMELLEANRKIINVEHSIY